MMNENFYCLIKGMLKMEKTKKNEERNERELGYSLLDFENSDEFDETTTTPYIKQVGEVLVTGSGKVKLNKEEIMGTIKELQNITDSDVSVLIEAMKSKLLKV